MHVAFIQAFGVSSPGGGPRILRGLLKDAPVGWTSFCTYPEPPPPVPFGREEHLPKRPWFGRIERTRFSWLPNRTEPLFESHFEWNLELRLRACGATAVHSIPHGLDFVHGYRIARRLGLRFLLNMQDDLRGTAAKQSESAECLKCLEEIWKDAEHRFVISEQLGEEYNRRYGERPFEVITDGIESVYKPRERPEGALRIYFMGLFHIRYEPNLRILLDAIEMIRKQRPEVEISVVCRCGALRGSVVRDFQGLKVLPFASEAEVEADMREADLLYMPLPFGDENADFVRYSLSTKMITYLGSGLPILYHGPSASAACEVLSTSEAALWCCDMAANTIAAGLREVIDDRTRVRAIVNNALRLAEKRFMLHEQRRKFWGGILGTRTAGTP